MKAVELDKLLDNLVVATALAGEAPEITGITTDPELCRPGFLYLADISESVDSKRLGVRLDGRDFIARAVQNGAVVVLTTPDVVLPAVSAPGDRQVILIKHERPLVLLGALCARFYGEPRPQHIALVTGTNGKTSTVNFCRMLWAGAHLPACSIGNLGGVCSDGSLVWERDATLSVPETVTLHNILHTIAARGFNHVAMEATSHALYDQRVTSLGATIGAFTNITRDHLDFHGDMDEYFRVKMTLFSEALPPGSIAVLNADADADTDNIDTEAFDGLQKQGRYAEALAICKQYGHKVISYGFNGEDLRLVDCEDVDDGQNLVLEIFGKKHTCHLNLSGLFQVSNVMCALSIVIGSGVPVERALALVPGLTEVEGRLNTVAYTPAGGRVIVDYAHSTHALRAALEAARSLTAGRLIVVFGCGGERDPGKRAAMGAVAAKIADQVIVTDDNPRREDPTSIRRAVMVGAPRALEVDNRVKAIEIAMRSLLKGDSVLIAGKGHENTQTIGEESLPYSDIETARHLAAELEQATYEVRSKSKRY